jgi:heptosyltransferase-2
MKILVRSTNWLGDAVMATPALLRLREKFPGAHIAILAAEKLRELWLNHPAVDETICFAPGESVFSIGRKLRAEKFDVALVLPNSPRSALEVFLAGIPQRIGHARPWRNFFMTQTVAPRADAVKMRKSSLPEIQRKIATETQSAQRKKSVELCGLCDSAAKLENLKHQTHEYLHLAAALGSNPKPLPPQLFVLPEEVESAGKKFGLDKISNPIFGLNPGAEYGPAKRWPVERFVLAAKEIQQRTGCVWILFGGKGDAVITSQIVSQLPTSNFQLLNLSGQTSLRELMSLLKLCRVLLTNDSGPMHVAAALGTPVVVPFGSTSPELTGPGLPGDARNHLLKSDAPCSPCFLRECPIDFRCMNGISIGRVVEAVMASLNC